MNIPIDVFVIFAMIGLNLANLVIMRKYLNEIWSLDGLAKFTLICMMTGELLKSVFFMVHLWAMGHIVGLLVGLIGHIISLISYFVYFFIIHRKKSVKFIFIDFVLFAVLLTLSIGSVLVNYYILLLIPSMTIIIDLILSRKMSRTRLIFIFGWFLNIFGSTLLLLKEGGTAFGALDLYTSYGSFYPYFLTSVTGLIFMMSSISKARKLPKFELGLKGKKIVDKSESSDEEIQEHEYGTNYQPDEIRPQDTETVYKEPGFEESEYLEEKLDSKEDEFEPVENEIETESEDIKQKLHRMLKVSNRIKISMMLNYLEIDQDTLEKHIFEWAEEFGFKIDGDEIVIHDENIDGFIEKLDQKYSEWQDGGTTNKKI